MTSLVFILATGGNIFYPESTNALVCQIKKYNKVEQLHPFHQTCVYNHNKLKSLSVFRTIANFTLTDLTTGGDLKNI